MWLRMKSENVCRRKKDFDWTTSSNSPPFEPESKTKKVKGTALRWSLYSRSSSSWKRLAKGT